MTTDQLTSAEKKARVRMFSRPASWSPPPGLGLRHRRDNSDRAAPESGRGGYGWDGGFGTYWFNDPAEDLTAILLTQQAWTAPSPPAICQDFWTSTYRALAD